MDASSDFANAYIEYSDALDALDNEYSDYTYVDEASDETDGALQYYYDINGEQEEDEVILYDEAVDANVDEYAANDYYQEEYNFDYYLDEETDAESVADEYDYYQNDVDSDPSSAWKF